MLITASTEATKQHSESRSNIRTIGIAMAIATQYPTFTIAEPKYLQAFLNEVTVHPFQIYINISVQTLASQPYFVNLLSS